MNIKNKLGVTLTLLVITILVMLLLFGITFSTGVDLLKNSQKTKMKTMLYMVKSRAEVLNDDFLFKYSTEEWNAFLNDNDNNEIVKEIQVLLGGECLAKTTDIPLIKRLGYESTNVFPNFSEKIYCLWDKETLEKQGIDTENLAKEDTIVIEYDLVNETIDVASKKGFSDGDISIHKLSDF